MNAEKGFEREKSLSNEAYLSDAYLSDGQWVDFAFQTRLVYKTAKSMNWNYEQQNILEIGKGSGFVQAALKNIGFQLETMDINEHLMPDHVQNIASLDEDFMQNKFDMILCAEVLEHIPFEKFELCISNISNLLKNGGRMILTIPNCYLALPIGLNLPKIHVNKFLQTKFKKRIATMHFWEIGSDDISEKHVVNIIKKYFSIQENGIIPPIAYHNYYVCKKNKEQQNA